MPRRQRWTRRAPTRQRWPVPHPPPINGTLKLFADLNAQLAAVAAAKASKTPPPPAGGAEKVKAEAAQQPDLVRGMVEEAADATIGQSRGAEREGLTVELKPITDQCNKSVTGRYPFASGSKADVPIEDFGQLFGAGGKLDDFFQRRLVPLVDQSAPVWAYRPLTDGSRPVSPASLAEFQRAQRIKDVFFRAGGQTPSVRIEIRLSELEPSLKELVFEIDGQQQKLTTSGQPITISWPGTRLQSQIKISTGLGNAGPMFLTEPSAWALFRLFERFEIVPSGVPEHFSAIMNLDGKRARLEVTSSSVFNPFQLREIKQFRCPAAL